MKRNTLTVLIGGILIVIFALVLFTFQVRQTEVVVVTTFDNPSRLIEEPGLYFKWPRPIQRVYAFDKRIQSFGDDEDKLEETLTADQRPLLVQLYAGWTITNPTNFFNSFPSGLVADARPALEGLIRTEKNAVVGQHPFSDFISTNQARLKFEAIEQEILKAVKPAALRNYGIDIQFIGIEQLKLPESVTQKVFERMKAERQRVVSLLEAQGDSEATKIRSEANSVRGKLLAEADAKATLLRGEADALAAKSYEVFDKNPELAIFLRKLSALEATMKDNATLIFDERVMPFDLFVGAKKLLAPDSDAGTPVRPGSEPNSESGNTR